MRGSSGLLRIQRPRLLGIASRRLLLLLILRRRRQGGGDRSHPFLKLFLRFCCKPENIILWSPSRRNHLNTDKLKLLIEDCQMKVEHF